MPAEDNSPFRRSRFEAALNENFRIRAFDADGAEVEFILTLIEVTPRRSPPGNEQFSNVFRGAAEPALGQGLYLVQSHSFGTEELFLVPIGFERDGARLYEAFVNRMIEA